MSDDKLIGVFNVPGRVEGKTLIVAEKPKKPETTNNKTEEETNHEQHKEQKSDK